MTNKVVFVNGEKRVIPLTPAEEAARIERGQRPPPPEPVEWRALRALAARIGPNAETEINNILGG